MKQSEIRDIYDDDAWDRYDDDDEEFGLNDVDVQTPLDSLDVFAGFYTAIQGKPLSLSLSLAKAPNEPTVTPTKAINVL